MPFEPSAAPPLAERPQQQRTLLLPLLLVAGLIVALAAIVSVREFSAQRRAAEAELLAVADLRRVQVQTWLHERLRMAAFSPPARRSRVSTQTGARTAARRRWAR